MSHESPLRQLQALLRAADGPRRVEELARALNAQPGAVFGMLELLVRRGRVLVIGPDDKPCNDCPLQSACTLPVTHGTRYALAQRAEVDVVPA